jgi:hypothetical protein
VSEIRENENGWGGKKTGRDEVKKRVKKKAPKYIHTSTKLEKGCPVW